MTHEGIATDSDEELLQRLFTSDHKNYSLRGNALTLVTQETQLDHSRAKTGIASVAIQESQDRLNDALDPYVELPAHQNAVQFLQVIFNDERVDNITEAQASGAVELLMELYQDIKGHRVNDEKIDRLTERLILHFSGLSDSYIANVDDKSRNAQGIYVSRRELLDLIIKHYSPPQLSIILDMIIDSPSGTSVNSKATSILEDKSIVSPLTSFTHEAIQQAMRLHFNEDLSWQDLALCAQTDPEEFYPEKGGSTRAAKQVCLKCPVRQECLDYALDNDERFGIWGGLSERERRRLKKRPN